ncbi:metal-dependent transcriptional regulator [Halococcus saccharolyticus]|uniref:DtxR family iron (Metal) dependent repressor n=1 Tax=Halococcus saccharolyticus DSM 5350 TaxID=1227455 RepID=M0MK16_9EURY|nr:metal-dependent transcriptional regulator [Halococcus saccharolyticus]EMA46017.1 DtxR family iron (metal) dependent repressor [Halococcus saccharolyticus DSM 5350]
MSSAKAEDYIKAVYQLSDGEEPVPPSEIAEALDVTTPTVTATMKRLADQDLIEREEYKGSHLTEEGELLAIETIRHHRLLELFLAEQLNYDWTEVHNEADRLEHHISERFETELAAALDEPTVDPHGSPIPTADLEQSKENDAPLYEFGEGDSVIVAQVADRDSEVLDYLAEAGITPGTRLEINEIAPFGMVTVTPTNEDGDESVSLPEEIAATVRVRDLDPDEPDNGSVLAG